MKVTLSFRVAVLRTCSPRENVFDALGRKLELNLQTPCACGLILSAPGHAADIDGSLFRPLKHNGKQLYLDKNAVMNSAKA